MKTVSRRNLLPKQPGIHAGLASLRVRLLGLILLALVPLFGLMLYAASEQRLQGAQLAQEDALRVARLAAARQEQLIEGARLLLIALAQLPAIRNHDQAACTLFLANLLAKYPAYANFGAVDRDGNIFCMGLPYDTQVNVADRSYYKGAVANRDFAVGEYAITRANARTVITFGYPVVDDQDQVQGIVFAGLNLWWLNQFAAEAVLPTGASLRVIDRNGTTLVHYPTKEDAIGQVMPEPDLLRTILTEREGVTEGVGTDGVPCLYAFTRLHSGPGMDVYMSVHIPKAVAFAPADRELARNLAVLGIVAALALAAVWLGSNWFILDRINILVDATRRLSAGDLTARAGRSDGGELGQLATAFDEMAETLQRRDEEQQRAQEQIQRQAIRTQSLAHIANRLNAQIDLDDVLKAVCEETSRACNVPAASVNLYDQDRGALVHSACFGLDSELCSRCQPIPRSLFDSYSAREGPIIRFPDIQLVPSYPNAQLLSSFNIRTVVCVSLVHEERLIGSLNLFSFQIREFTDDELTLLKGASDEAALAIANARLYHALQQEERARAQLLHKVISAQEDERMRIARELHDETGQSLSALMLGLDVAQIIMTEDREQAAAHLQDMKAIAEGMLRNTRRLIADLRPSLLDDLGLVPAIAWYGEQRLNALGIALEMKETNLRERLPRTVETALFRVVQEGITNVIRHANAKRVVIVLARQDGHLALEIADNGRGFDPQILHSNDAEGKGLGLRGMQERVTILGGEFDLRSAPGNGTVITVRVPIKQV